MSQMIMLRSSARGPSDLRSGVFSAPRGQASEPGASRPPRLSSGMSGAALNGGQGEEDMDAEPTSRPSFVPPPEKDLRALAASLVASFREEENFSLFESYARIALPGSNNPTEDLVAQEMRRHLGVVKALRPRAEDVMLLLERHIRGWPDRDIKGYKEVIFDFLTAATNEPPRTYNVSSKRAGYPILIGSRRCIVIVERQDNELRLIDLQTEKDFTSQKKTRKSNLGIFRRQFASR